MSRMPIIVLIILFGFITSCSEKKSYPESEINISVTIPPYADFVHQITGNRANITILIPPGINAHAFEPDPNSLKSVYNSNIYFRVGKIFNIENILINKIGSDKIEKIIDCSEDINIINNDPHIWLSPKNVKIITKTMLNKLTNDYPAHKNYFRNNWNKFIEKLESIDSSIDSLVKLKENKIFLVYHPAWTYFAEHYGLIQYSIEIDGKTPKAGFVKNVIDLIKENNIKIIFYDPHFDKSAVETIAKSVGIEAQSLDPLPTNYLGNMEDIRNKLRIFL